MPWMVGLGAGALSAAGGIFSSGSSRRAAQAQMRFQERMANTTWQRGVADMQAAGINPMLAVSQGGAPAPGGASPTHFENIGEKFVTGAQHAASMRNTKLQGDILEGPAALGRIAGEAARKLEGPGGRELVTNAIEKAAQAVQSTAEGASRALEGVTSLPSRALNAVRAPEKVINTIVDLIESLPDKSIEGIINSAKDATRKPEGFRPPPPYGSGRGSMVKKPGGGWIWRDLK